MPFPADDFARLDAINRLTTVGRLLSSVVHEAGNSLQVIGGHAELLQGPRIDQEKVDARLRAIASYSTQAAIRLREVSGLLRDAGDEPAAAVDLRAVCVEAMGLRSFSFGRGRITAQIQPDSGRFQVRAVRSQVLRILLNLLMNAEAALKPQGGTIQITLENTGASIRATIADSGPGISADRRESLFEAFATAGGPGLGLHVSRGLAVRNGGSLELLDSAPGAAFVLTLPSP